MRAGVKLPNKANSREITGSISPNDNFEIPGLIALSCWNSNFSPRGLPGQVGGTSRGGPRAQSELDLIVPLVQGWL